MRATILLVVLGTSTAATAEPQISTPEPVVAFDDTRTHSAVLLESYQIAATYRRFFHESDADLMTLQLGLGPMTFEETHARTLLDWFHRYSLRLRGTVANVASDATVGPITIAVQRYYYVDHVAIAPLVHLHLGFETAISSPWASDRMQPPPEPIRSASHVDTELTSNGWSVRPFAPYIRADILLCRSLGVELGASPEVFVPTALDRSKEYDVRFHGILGVSLACVHTRDSWTKNIDVVLEYRARARLYADEGPALFSDLGLELQRRGNLTIGASINTNFSSFVGIGGRFQFGGR